MKQRMHNYLRTYRKRAGLTQDEMTQLLGCQSGTKVSRYERLSRKPNLETAFACQVIVGIPAHELFPGVYKEVEILTKKRVQELSEKLVATQSSPVGDYKMRMLSNIISPNAVEPSQHI